MVDPNEAIKRKLDDVVGTQFDPVDARHLTRNRVLKWIGAAASAVAMVALIVFIIESHRLPPKIPPRATKPVVIQIVPSPPRSP